MYLSNVSFNFQENSLNYIISNYTYVDKSRIKDLIGENNTITLYERNCYYFASFAGIFSYWQEKNTTW